MTRSIKVFLLVGLCAGSACRTSDPCATGSAAAMCGGTTTRPGETAVTVGMDHELFTATNRQTIVLKPGLTLEPWRDADGRPRGVTIMALDNSPGITMSCQCPDGCSSAPPGTDEGDLYLGCAVLTGEGSSTAFCSGDCHDESSCCGGCGWVQVPG